MGDMGSIDNLRRAAVVLLALAMIVGMGAGSAAAADGDDGLTGDDGLGVDTDDTNVTETVEGVSDGDVTGTVTETTDTLTGEGSTTVSPSDVTGTTVDPESPVDWEDTADDVPVNYCNPKGRVNDRIPRGEIPPSAGLVLSLVIGEVPDTGPCDVYNLNDPQFDPTNAPTDPTVGWARLQPDVGADGASADPIVIVAAGGDWPAGYVDGDLEASQDEVSVGGDLVGAGYADGNAGSGGLTVQPGSPNASAGDVEGEVLGSSMLVVDCADGSCLVDGPSLVYTEVPPDGMEADPTADVEPRRTDVGPDGGTLWLVGSGDAGSDLADGVAVLFVGATPENVRVVSGGVADELYPNAANPPGLVPVSLTDDAQYVAVADHDVGTTSGEVLVSGAMAGEDGSVTLRCDSSGCERSVDRPSAPEPPSAPSPPSPPGVPGLPVNPPGLAALTDAASVLPVL